MTTAEEAMAKMVEIRDSLVRTLDAQKEAITKGLDEMGKIVATSVSQTALNEDGLKVLAQHIAGNEEFIEAVAEQITDFLKDEAIKSITKEISARDIAGEIDTSEVAREVADNIDTRDIADRVIGNIDMDDLERNIKESIDIGEIANDIAEDKDNMDALAKKVLENLLLKVNTAQQTL